MQSYASPGRVITVANIGTDAVAVRADQPYRLGNLVGVTDAPAGVGDDLNLCVEGVFEQMVDLADGVEAAEAGTSVLMNVATFALVVGLTDAADHVQFGVLAERMTRRRVVLVKLMPATAAAPATGGGDGGNGGGGGSTGAQSIILSGVLVGPGYYTHPRDAAVTGSGFDGQDLQPQNVVAKSDGIQWPAARFAGQTPSKSYVQVSEAGIYRLSINLAFYNWNTAPMPNGAGLMVRALTFDPSGAANGWVAVTHGRAFEPRHQQYEANIHRLPGASPSVRRHWRDSAEVYLAAGSKLSFAISAFQPDGSDGFLQIETFAPDPSVEPNAVNIAPMIILEKIA